MDNNIERKFYWCIEKGKAGGRKHRGLRKIKPDIQEAENHIQKALHNLKAVGYNIKGGFWGLGCFSRLLCDVPFVISHFV
ncbi:MAG: hypothetical protein ACOY3D_04370 [Candidatus Omnitrophota bacterium]